MDIGKKLTALREVAGLSQNQLAKLSGIKQGQISKIESGINTSPKRDTLLALCNAIDVSLAEFDDNPIEKVIRHAEQMNLTADQQAALIKYKKMPLTEQQTRLMNVLNKYKSLPASDQEALAKIIDSLASTRR